VCHGWDQWFLKCGIMHPLLSVCQTI